MSFEDRYMGFKLVTGKEGLGSVAELRAYIDGCLFQDKLPDVINVTYQCYHEIRSSNDLWFERVWE